MAAHRKSDQRRDDPLRGPDFVNVHGSGWLQRLVRCFWWHNARRRENEAKHTAARQPSNYHAAEAECRIIPCVKLNYCTILESRRRCTGQHKPNVLNMAVGCANAGSDMLAPAP